MEDREERREEERRLGEKGGKGEEREGRREVGVSGGGGEGAGKVGRQHGSR